MLMVPFRPMVSRHRPDRSDRTCIGPQDGQVRIRSCPYIDKGREAGLISPSAAQQGASQISGHDPSPAGLYAGSACDRPPLSLTPAERETCVSTSSFTPESPRELPTAPTSRRHQSTRIHVVVDDFAHSAAVERRPVAGVDGLDGQGAQPTHTADVCRNVGLMELIE